MRHTAPPTPPLSSPPIIKTENGGRKNVPSPPPPTNRKKGPNPMDAGPAWGVCVLLDYENIFISYVEIQISGARGPRVKKPPWEAIEFTTALSPPSKALAPSKETKQRRRLFIPPCCTSRQGTEHPVKV